MKHGQAIVGALLSTLITAVYGVASFFQEDPEVFLFPRIVTVAMVILTVGIWISAVLPTRRTTVVDAIQWPALLPGVTIGLGYFSVLEWLGFYSASFIAFFLLVLIYDRRSHLGWRPVVRNLAISAAFMGALYLLFWNGLQVRTPSGLLL